MRQNIKAKLFDSLEEGLLMNQNFDINEDFGTYSTMNL